MSARCDMSDLPVETCGCGHCRPDLAPAAPTRQRVITTSTAVFGSRCAGCDAPIQVGDPIVLLDRDGWVCADCSPP